MYGIDDRNCRLMICLFTRIFARCSVETNAVFDASLAKSSTAAANTVNIATTVASTSLSTNFCF